jgi:hypothetical protein
MNREIGNLKSAILALNTAKDETIDIADIFASGAEEDDLYKEIDALSYGEIPSVSSDELLPVQQEAAIKKNVPKKQVSKESVDAEINGSLKSAMRQSAILERIRAIGNCRLSDIQAILPDSSERTIRYDLESLVQQNLIERVGTGGRGVYYKVPVSEFKPQELISDFEVLED